MRVLTNRSKGIPSCSASSRAERYREPGNSAWRWSLILKHAANNNFRSKRTTVVRRRELAEHWGCIVSIVPNRHRSYILSAAQGEGLSKYEQGIEVNASWANSVRERLTLRAASSASVFSSSDTLIVMVVILESALPSAELLTRISAFQLPDHTPEPVDFTAFDDLKRG